MKIILMLTEDETEEVLFGLETIISDRCGSKAEAEGPRLLIEKIKQQRDKCLQPPKELPTWIPRMIERGEK